MLKVYFITQERFDEYDSKLKPQEKFVNARLSALGIKNRTYKDSVVVVTPDYGDDDFPGLK